MTSKTRSYPQILTVLVGVTHPDVQRADAALGAPTHARTGSAGSGVGDRPRVMAVHGCRSGRLLWLMEMS